LVFLLGACRSRRSLAANEQADLGGQIAARVGTEAIPLALVAKVSASQRVPADAALRVLIDDAIAADAARTRGLDKKTPTSWRLRAARARFTSNKLFADAKTLGPPSDDEVRTLSAEYWRQVDRPPSVRTIHAIVKRPEKADAAKLRDADKLAGEIRTAVANASSAEQFKSKAEAVPHAGGLEILVEQLPAFIENGDIVEGSGAMAMPFVRAAFALAYAGDTSPVVETPFGWHVIRLIERIPEERMPFESRRAAFTDEAYGLRVRRALDVILADANKTSPSMVLPSAESLMREVIVEGQSAR